MRSYEEIVVRIREIMKTDFFGFESSDLLSFLPFSHAKEFLKPEAIEENWTYKEPTNENVEKELKDYMSFAWEKANNRRGLSAMRSISHMRAWLWLLGQAEAAEEIASYSCYGKPQLAAICQKFNIDWTKFDDGGWSNNESDFNQMPREPVLLTWN